MRKDPNKFAKRCRREAEQAINAEIAQNFLQIAEDLERLARELDEYRPANKTSGGEHGRHRISRGQGATGD